MELDFIPSWYHEKRQRRNWYVRRYMVIAVITGLWIVGNLFSGRFISKAYADLGVLRETYEKGLRNVIQVRHLQERLSVLNRQSQILHQLRPRTPVSPVLAELSRCIGGRVVLTELSLVQTPLEARSASSQKTPAAQAKPAGSPKNDWRTGADTVLRIRLVGFAVDGAEVASLICRLEESEYFTEVIPVYSKNQTRFGTSAAEFEIQCVLADFTVREQK